MIGAYVRIKAQIQHENKKEKRKHRDDAPAAFHMIDEVLISGAEITVKEKQQDREE